MAAAAAGATGAQPSDAPLQFFDQLRRRFNVGPANWDHFRQGAADSVVGEGGHGGISAGSVPLSGAHVALSDLARDPRSLPAPLDEASGVAADELDSDVLVVAPDPTKYGPATNHLEPAELREEAAKGNVYRWGDIKRALDSLGTEDQEDVLRLVYKQYAQDDAFVTLDDGSKVSLWDLQQYAFNNPEGQALANSRRSIPIVNPDDPAGPPLWPAASPTARQGGQAGLVLEGREAEELGLDWGLVGQCALWKRRPTRWLKGIDGLQDWQLEVYSHEVLAHTVLGGKYGQRDPRQVLGDPQYKQDVLRCGPLLGMTFILKAARDIPLQEVASSWSSRLRDYLQRQAPLQVPERLRTTPLDPRDLNDANWAGALLQTSRAGAAVDADDGADELGVRWRTMGEQEHKESVQQGLGYAQALPRLLGPSPSSALAGSKLLDAQGATWLQGSSLWVTLGPEGAVLLQAQSPGLVKDQQSYLLGAVHNEALCGALMDMAVGPRPLEQELAEGTRSGMLLHVHGFKTGNTNGDPNFPAPPLEPVRLPRVPANPRHYVLERVGAPAAGTLVGGIGEVLMYRGLQELFEKASQAAYAAEDDGLTPSSSGTQANAMDGSPGDGRAQQAKQRAQEAARAVLKDGLAKLGPAAVAYVQQRQEAVAGGQTGVGALAVHELFSLARPLQEV